MRVADYATSTHAGRVRRKNEDAYYAEPPLFAVADGMGGALAGELASRIAVQALGDLVEEGGDEERLASTVRLANRRVAERATSDPRASGMGSTVTAALVGSRSVAFAHVGDSRAYLWRGGALTRLSDDHSLVAEWVKAGALAPEEAALHPQRSVITRALGADWQVDVDTWTLPARPGDVILLCTDGLTGFVDEAAIAAALAENDDLHAVVEGLVDAANAAGGEDNITAVALRLEADEDAAGGPPAAADADDERETGEIDALPEPAPESAGESTAVAVAVATPPAAPERDAAEFETSSPPPVPAPLPRSGETLISVPPLVTGFGSGAPVRRRGRARRLGVFAAVVALMLCVLWAALIGLRWSHFVGVDPATGKVAVYQGIPYDLGGGMKLFSLVHVSRITAATLPAARRKHLFDHSLRSSESARSLVAKLEQTEP
ncbi:MAG TPA: Stp1/IreP family PP2C-type Ser/Thr phosphatase [Gaiellales bacterium]|nr:Stp1/IreP family PP2C-type Ser/Thr phosphatase [Gaiellales bacterium]